MSINTTSNNLYNRVREAVHHEWDPIGVSIYSKEMGEYDGYLQNLFILLKGNCSQEDIFDYLWEVEINSMGLSGNRGATEAFSEYLYRLKKS